MAVPYTFGTATAAIPLSQLDSNFATTITLGNTATQLGNTVTTLNNMTLANVTVSSGNVTFTNVSATLANVTTANITTEFVGTSTITTASITTANITTANVSTALSYSGTLTGGTGIVNLGSGQFYKDASGNLGIGTTSPSTYTTGTVLAVNSSGAETTPLALVNSNGGANTQVSLAFTPNTNIPLAKISAIRTSAGGLTSMTFGTYSGSAVTEAMRIDSSGNVGIGNTAANVNDQFGAVRPLLVSKSDSATTIAGSQAAIVIGNDNTTTSNTSQLTFATLTGANTNYYASAAINCVFGARTNGSYPTGQLVFSTSTTLNLAPTEKMRIDSSGNVGIGTSSPNASAILDAQSTTKGVRMPNMTTTQKNAISSPAAGLMVFDTTLAKLCVYSGSAWQTITSV